MYSRVSNQKRSVSVPENYSGNAFRDGIYTDITPKDSPHFPPTSQNIPQRGTSYAGDGIKEKTAYTRNDNSGAENEETPHDPLPVLANIRSTEDQANADPRSSSIFSSLLPSFSASNKFPFGHGIGTEELFILGMMLLIYTSSDEGASPDSELLLLLCILLFLG